ncbi:hypothetical protein [Phyllobacterium zundukense]|uniref:Uncharacterized protein n=1 Tax=Phyllobacterium zundukense TaxID=1867719 RepID=A0ACD4D6N2_9HYPH|nr:hypothetical protein [Phyllobacterium zundukense]UXN61597.1 hypothetical protein N8E88_16180 [Phyllobacterium zundukense]
MVRGNNPGHRDDPTTSPFGHLDGTAERKQRIWMIVLRVLQPYSGTAVLAPALRILAGLVVLGALIYWMASLLCVVRQAHHEGD